MANENKDDFCKDCGPTLKAFLEEMAEHNKEQMDLNPNATCPICGKVHEYTFPYSPRENVPPSSAL